MWESFGTCPGHSEHHMNWTAQCLRAVDVGKAWWIGDNCVGNKWVVSSRIRADAGFPCAIKDLGDHLALSRDLASSQTLHARQKTRILDHISHELCWVAANGEKAKSRIGFLDKVLEDSMRSEAHPVSILQKTIRQGNKRLDVSPTADNLYHDVQLDAACLCRRGCLYFWLRIEWYLRGLMRERGENPCDSPTNFRIDLTVDTSIYLAVSTVKFSS